MPEPTRDYAAPAPTADHSTRDPNATTGHDARFPGPRAAPEGYELREEVGRGGMGVVYRARDLALGRDVAVKLLRYQTPGGVERFLTEAGITARLQHPGIPPVHQVGTFSNGSPFLVMKLIRGETLADLLAGRESPAADVARFVAAFEQVCQAVGYAHSQGIIHRDLKPSNVMVGAFGEVQVMDWGLAKTGDRGREAGAGEDARGAAVTRCGAPETLAGEVLGTPAYMPPEQASGEKNKIDARADVFALGGILCEILTGKPPHVGDGVRDVVLAATSGDVSAAFRRLDACGADAELVALAKRCLAPDVAHRPANAEAVAEAVSAYRAGVSERLRKAEEERAVAAAEAREQRKRRRVQLALAGVVFVLFAAGGAGAWWYLADRQKRQTEENTRLADRERRQHDVRREVLAAVAQANKQLDACAGLADDAVRWDAALVAARADAGRADGVLKSAESAEADLRAAVEALFTRLESADQVRRFVARLEELAASMPDRDGRRFVDADYYAAFRDAGIDAARLSPAEFAERATRPPYGESIALSLFYWSNAADLPPGRRELLQAAIRAARRTFSLPEALTAAEARELADRLHPAALPPRRIQMFAELASHSDRDSALAILTEGATQYPNDFLLQSLAGIVQVDRQPRRYSDASRHFQAAVAVRPRSASARSNLSVALLELKYPAEAAAQARLATQYDPNNHLGFAHLGSALVELGDSKGAIAAQRRALELRPGYAKSHYGLGLALEKSGDAAGALASYRRAAELDPRLPQAHHNLGSLLKDAGNLHAAAASLRVAHALQPEEYDTLTLLGNVLDMLGHRETAGGLLLKAVGLRPDGPDALALLALNRLGSDQLDDAVRCLRDAEKSPPSDTFPRALLADTELFAEGMRALDRRLPDVLAGREKPDAEESLRFWVLCTRVKGMYATGTRFFEAWASANPVVAADTSGLRFDAGKAALLAGFGRGPDAPSSPEDLAALRKQAVRFLAGEQSVWGIQSAARPDRAPAAHAAMTRWKADPHLAFTQSAFGRLVFPPDERAEWERLWNSVETVRERTAPKK